MKIPPETICSIAKCKKIFCCEKCRKKHEEKTHAIVIKSQKNGSRDTSNVNGETANSLYVLCPICSNQPFILQKEFFPEEVLVHIEQNHLPLHCKRCTKVYTKKEELREFSKCIKTCSKPEIEKCMPDDRNVYAPDINKNLMATKKYSPIELNTISTQTSPMLTDETNAISVKGLRRNARIQSMQEVSFSSIKNLSLCSNSSSHRRLADTRGKLVRTTSTPVHYEAENLKPKERTFNASGAQVSSIYNSGCEVDNEKSTPISAEGAARPASLLTVPAQVDSFSYYRKFSGRSKVAAVTPLRHVIIQKAFAEHGLPTTSEQKKKHQLNEASAVLLNQPLDLRLSPALRRSQSELVDNVKCVAAASTSKPLDYVSATRKTTTNSLVIRCAEELRHCETAEEAFNSNSAVGNSTNSSVYKTCQSIEIITSTELSEIEVVENVFDAPESNDKLSALKNVCLQKSPKSAVNTPITRLSGTNITKKFIKFETPNVKNDSSHDKFYTPGTPSCSTGSHNINGSFVSKSADRREFLKCSPRCRPSIRECAQSTAYSHYDIDSDLSDEVFLTPTNGNSKKKVETSDQSTQHGNGFIWSFMSSFMQKGTRFLENKHLSFDAEKKESLIKRCSSVAGSLVRSNSLCDEKQLQPMKRKRTNTCDSQTSPSSNVRRSDSMPQHLGNISSSKRFRIQGRKPIERMRNTSL